MEFFKQLKEVTLSVLPIVVAAIILGLVFGAFGEVALLQFILSSLLLILGLSLFLLGVNMGFLPIGNHLGALITSKRSVALLLGSGFFLGVLVTLAEPDVRVLSGQVASVDPSVSVSTFVMVIAIGVGLFMALSYIRALSRFSFKITMAIGVGVMIVTSLLVPSFFASIGFDAGGATTGPLAVPFILALGMGVASVHGNKEEDSFGFTGLASIGPVLAVLAYGLFLKGGASSSISEEVQHSLGEIFFSVVKNVSSSLLPIVAVSVVMLVFFMKMPRIRMMRIVMGIIYSFLGIVMFLFAVESSFMPLSRALGGRIASSNPALLVILGFLFGFTVVLAEPAIWVLTEEVEEKSEGRIRRRMMLLSIASGVAMAVALSMLRILLGISIRAILVPIYVLIIVLLPLVPTLFAAIAFDSGGVATGPMSSTFLLPFALGASALLSEGNGESAFGMIGLIASMPILAIEILGVIYRIKTGKGEKK